MEKQAVTLTRRHCRRLREMYRSAGWPCLDAIEVELLAAGLLVRVLHPDGRETLRVSDAGIAVLAEVLASNKAARSAHETLVERVALEMCRAGRLVWRGLSLRARVADPCDEGRHVWCVACPDVFSIRHTTVEASLEPVVHEIKVSRADLLGDLKKPAKRAAYLDIGGACWYVLGEGANGKPIAAAHEIPAECGVMQWTDGRLEILRAAPRRTVERLPLHVWMALAKGTPVKEIADDAQALL